MECIENSVEKIVKVTDGDTIRAVLCSDEMVVSITKTMRVRTRDAVKGEPLRLIIVNTPERGQPGYAEATADLKAWLQEHEGRLRCTTYESAGWDRTLADLYVEGDRGNTATQHLLLLGWPAYVR
jgi:endonuclease YncB( thermonuclease family)